MHDGEYGQIFTQLLLSLFKVFVTVNSFIFQVRFSGAFPFIFSPQIEVMTRFPILDFNFSLSTSLRKKKSYFTGIFRVKTANCRSELVLSFFLWWRACISPINLKRSRLANSREKRWNMLTSHHPGDRKQPRTGGLKLEHVCNQIQPAS